MRRLVVSILLCCTAALMAGDTGALQRIVSDLTNMGGHPSVVEEQGPYTRIQLTDSATLEIYEADNYLVLMTVCAPQCSSCARVYNKEGELIEQITPPLRSVFPLATMDKQTGRITWTDNDEWEY